MNVYILKRVMPMKDSYIKISYINLARYKVKT